MTASYSAIIEELFVNLGGPVVAFLLIGGDNYVLILWRVLVTLGIQVNHRLGYKVYYFILNTSFYLSGYKLPWVPKGNNSSKFHDDHHRLFNKNFGAIGLMDWLHGTTAK